MARLGVVHQTTLPYSPYQNAKQESFWGRVEGRLMAMLEGEAALTLELLNAGHPGLGRAGVSPHACTRELDSHAAGALSGRPERAARPCPDYGRADRRPSASRSRAAQRRADGTVSLAGTRFEIPSRYRHLRVVHLRYARWDLSRSISSIRAAAPCCARSQPLDKSANADGQRRRAAHRSAPDLSPLPPAGMAPLLRQLLADYAATGLPPAYLPMPTIRNPPA